MKNIIKFSLTIFVFYSITTSCKEDPFESDLGLPRPAFTVNETIIKVGETVNFTDKSTYSPSSWSWKFGDGGTSTVQNPQHTYEKTGNYTVELIVTNTYGSRTSTKTDFINVTDRGLVTMTDKGGNVYKTVKIGSQIWMAENLNYTSGSEAVIDRNSWQNLDSKDVAWCYPVGLPSDSPKYGVLYTYQAALDACPDGWHLPSDDEWKQLEIYIGMSPDEVDNSGQRGDEMGMKLKAEDNIWRNFPETNESGFSALPTGYRSDDGSFHGRNNAIFWSSTAYPNGSFPPSNWTRTLSGGFNGIDREGLELNSGLSVRYVKD